MLCLKKFYSRNFATVPTWNKQKENNMKISPEQQMLTDAQASVEQAFKILEGVYDFGRGKTYDNRYEKSNALSSLSEVSNTCQKILDGTNL
jgi:hypothetical protein